MSLDQNHDDKTVKRKISIYIYIIETQTKCVTLQQDEYIQQNFKKIHERKVNEGGGSPNKVNK